jgi:hypothetical protein
MEISKDFPSSEKTIEAASLFRQPPYLLIGFLGDSW